MGVDGKRASFSSNSRGSSEKVSQSERGATLKSGSPSAVSLR